MSSARFSQCVATAAAVAAMSNFSNKAYADSSFRFPFLSSSSSSSSDSQENQNSEAKSESQPPDEPKKSGFDPESLERGAKALRKINSSAYARQVLVCCLDLFLFVREMKDVVNIFLVMLCMYRFLI